MQVLAIACDRSSQNRVAKQLGRSASLVSNVLRNKYPGDMSAVEELVRGVLMHETVECPGLGAIEKQVCQKWRGRAVGDLDPVNSQYVAMYRTCRKCALFDEGAAS
ncbi:MAG: hypothetical protein AAGL96_19015 [Pseudomonadota bacterium]